MNSRELLSAQHPLRLLDLLLHPGQVQRLIDIDHGPRREERAVGRGDDAAHRVPDDDRRAVGNGTLLLQLRDGVVDVGREGRDVVRLRRLRIAVAADVDAHDGERSAEIDGISAAAVFGDPVHQDEERTGTGDVVGEDHGAAPVLGGSWMSQSLAGRAPR